MVLAGVFCDVPVLINIYIPTLSNIRLIPPYIVFPLCSLNPPIQHYIFHEKPAIHHPQTARTHIPTPPLLIPAQQSRRPATSTHPTLTHLAGHHEKLEPLLRLRHSTLYEIGRQEGWAAKGDH